MRGTNDRDFLLANLGPEILRFLSLKTKSGAAAKESLKRIEKIMCSLVAADHNPSFYKVLESVYENFVKRGVAGPKDIEKFFQPLIWRVLQER